MISIAMTSYNGEKYIVEQLESIRTQSLPPDEVIISDDKSTDNTIGIIDEYIRKHALTSWRVVKNPVNLGYIRNFWNTILLTKGDYIFLADQDDIWKKNKIESMVAVMKQTSALMLHTEVDIVDQDGHVIREAMNKLASGIKKLSMKEYMRKSHYCGMSSAMSGKLRELMRTINTDSFPTHDWCLGCLAVRYAGFYTCSNVYSLRRSHGDNAALNMEKTKRDGIHQREENVIQYKILYKAALSIAKDSHSDKETENIINGFIKVTDRRLEALEKRSIIKGLLNIMGVSYFPSPKAWISDMMYICGIF